jgi:hypothetical protein
MFESWGEVLRMAHSGFSTRSNSGAEVDVVPWWLDKIGMEQALGPPAGTCRAASGMLHVWSAPVLCKVRLIENGQIIPCRCRSQDFPLIDWLGTHLLLADQALETVGQKPVIQLRHQRENQ